MTERRFYHCKFRKNDKRAYCYHYDGDVLRVGSTVKVAARDGDGWTPTTIVDICPYVPDFDTKPILGPVDEPPQNSLML